MTIFFERLSFLSSFFYLFRNKKIFSQQKLERIYYIDTNRYVSVFIPIAEKYFGCTFSKLDFSLIDIKDSYGELERLKLTRKHLFDFKELILESSAYKEILVELYQSNLQANQHLKSYIEKSVIHSEIMQPGTWRTLFLISVISNFMKKESIEQSIFVIIRRSWLLQYQEFASSYGISIDYDQGMDAICDINLTSFIRRFPVIYFLLSILKYKNGFLDKNKDLGASLYLDGRGDIVFEKNGLHSDFLWHIESDYPAKKIVYRYENNNEKSLLHENNIDADKITPYLSDLFFITRKAVSLKKNSLFKAEFNQIKQPFDFYHANFHATRSFFARKNIKIYLTWDRYNADHIIKSAAIRSLGGISAIHQIAFDGVPLIDNQLHSDIVFSYSSLTANLDKEINSKSKYHVITGCTKDYLNPLLNDQANLIRDKLASNGVKHVVCVFDENSHSDERWHTGHSLQRENYSYILEEVITNQSLGVIFKPKHGKNLRKRLGKVNKLLQKAERTGRCLVLEEISRHTTAYSPIIAALSSDLCIHGHLCAGSAGLEAALSGIPTILIDREGLPDSKLHQLPKDKVVFSDWSSAIEGIKIFFSDRNKSTGIGDWSNLIVDLDPFRDGEGSKRMGSFLNDLRINFDQGMEREQSMELAIKKYKNDWGSDKIIENF